MLVEPAILAELTNVLPATRKHLRAMANERDQVQHGAEEPVQPKSLRQPSSPPAQHGSHARRLSNAHAAARYTWDGSAEVEAFTGAVVAEVAALVRAAIDPEELEALVLIGGYGRGEGGVELRGGRHVPHNNLDFLLVVRRGDPEELRRRIHAGVQAIAAARDIGIDVGAISARALRHADCRVIWYDMRHGHRTVLGNDRFVPSLKQHTVDRIPPWDARDLLTNRGSLLVINDLLLERDDVRDPDTGRLVVKHVIKAILGYGDAWLFFAGDYHWSYAEKRQRMRRRRDVDPRFRVLYDEAAAFRFRPDYRPFLGRDLREWCSAVKHRLSDVHRAVESARLGRDVRSWDDYLEPALTHVLWEEPTSPRAALRKLANAVRSRLSAQSLGPLARAGLAAAGARGTLPLVFPAAAYDDAGPGARARAAEILGAAGTDGAALKRAYLRRWGEAGDPNFANFVARHGLSIEEPNRR